MAGERCLASGKPQDLALDRPHGRRLALLYALHRTAPAPRSDHHVTGVDACLAGDDAKDPPVPLPDRGPDSGHDLAARALDPRHQRPDQGSRLGLVVLRCADATGHSRREARLEPAALGSREPLDLEPQRALEAVEAVELLGVVAVDRDHQRSPPLVARGLAGARAQALVELGPARGRFEVQPQQLLLAVARLRHRGKHPGGHSGGARAGGLALDHDGRETGLRRPPGAGEADHPRADHGHVIGAPLGR
jgi:hypothetical protein